SMKITICGSIAFIKEMEDAAKELEALGHEAKFPPTAYAGEDGKLIPALEHYQTKKDSVNDKSHWFWKHHDDTIRDHFDKIDWCDAILVLNYDKNGIAGYI